MQSELLHNRNRPTVSVANSLNFVANRTVFRQNHATSRCHERFRETLSGSARKIVNQTRGFNLMDRKLIAVAVSSALALPMAAQAVEFSVSGQVNRAIISQDGDGMDGSLRHADANSSESRFRFKGSEELDSGWSAGVNYELSSGATNTSYATAGKKQSVRIRQQSTSPRPRGQADHRSTVGGHRRHGQCRPEWRTFVVGRRDTLVFLSEQHDNPGLPEQRRRSQGSPEVRYSRHRCGLCQRVNGQR